ncbi:MAG: 30S ribosomal protein S1 [Lachnospiraceae bacterium]|jgi:ribosomal protein S1|nr:30S ribosomal protein S1 [Lachnospiraceae bacterium]
MSEQQEENFEQMLNASFKPIHTGEVVEGKVIDVKPAEAILNINYKADGVLTRNEYSNDNSLDLTTVLHVGDTLEVKVMKVSDTEGQVLLTYKRLAAERGNKRIEDAYNNKEVLTAKVTQVLSGGLSVNVEDVRVFIPASLVSDSYERDLSKYLDQEINFVITEYNPRRRRYIGDRKQLLMAKHAEMQAKLFETIKVGDVVEGTVKNITDFGAFVDLGGADGLLHISEMSWGRVENPKKVFKVGQPLKVLIKDIQGTKIALSLKFPDENPWIGASEKYAIGKIVTGRVARMTDFGAFVELEPGIDALLHVSQIAKEHIDKPSDVLKNGQEITAKIVDFNEADNKISLSVKALLNDEESHRKEQEEDSDVVSVDVDAAIAAAKAEEKAEEKKAEEKAAQDEAAAEGEEKKD